MKVSEVIFHLRPASPNARYGGIQKGLVGTGELSVFALFSVTKHNKELVEAKTWTSRSITNPPAFTVHKWKEGITGRYVLHPVKIVGTMRHSP